VTAPARALGLDPLPPIAPGAPADLLLVAGRDWHDALRAPARRLVLCAGQDMADNRKVPA